ncbi:MAG: hypothetical protein WC307_06640 [Candidatus Nanoarchaeia archaeon]|jgi:hypothetical protein
MIKNKTYKLNAFNVNKTTWCYSSRSNKTIGIYQQRPKKSSIFRDSVHRIYIKVSEIKKILKELSK